MAIWCDEVAICRYQGHFKAKVGHFKAKIGHFRLQTGILAAQAPGRGAPPLTVERCAAPPEWRLKTNLCRAGGAQRLQRAAKRASRPKREALQAASARRARRAPYHGDQPGLKTGLSRPQEPRNRPPASPCGNVSSNKAAPSADVSQYIAFKHSTTRNPAPFAPYAFKPTQAR